MYVPACILNVSTLTYLKLRYSHLLIAYVLRAVVGAQAGATSAPSDSAWIRRHVSDSIYLWACGEKEDHEDEEPKLSDRLIGWLILFVSRSGWLMYYPIDMARVVCKQQALLW